MALSSKSLILYSLQITDINKYIDFKISGGGSQLTAVLSLGFYSLTSLMTEVARAMSAADPVNTYTITADRTVLGGTQNRVTIATSGAYLSLLFGTGTHSAASTSSLIGFAASDRTGATSYKGSSTAGVALIPTLIGYNYLPQFLMQKVFGSVNVSVVGTEEAVTYPIQNFIQVQFKYEPYARMISEWVPFIQWMIQHRTFDFTPEISSPSTVYSCVIVKTKDDSKGLMHNWTEMLPKFPGLYDTGLLQFRIRQ